jgi:hypothetical protein
MSFAAAPDPTFRLIPSQFPPVDAFANVAAAADLAAVMKLEGWTNDSLVAQRLARLPRAEWAFDRPNASIVMAAFLHCAPSGGRFNGHDLGAWYGAFDLKTAIAEVAHHMRRELWNIDRPVSIRRFAAYRARLEGEYEDLRAAGELHADFHDPASHAGAQIYGEACRAAGGDGIIYDSLRVAGGVNVVAYRPNKIFDVEVTDYWRITASLDTGPIAQRMKA